MTNDWRRRVFAAELGCAPGPGLQVLYARLLRRAHEDDDELSRLLEAVVRLHMASRSGVRPPIADLGSGGRDAIVPDGSIELACHALNQLLRRVGGQPSPN